MKANPILSFALGMGLAYAIWGMRRRNATAPAAAPAPPQSTAVTQPATTFNPPAVAPQSVPRATAPASGLTMYQEAL